MLERLAFALSHYGMLAAFAVSAYGLGRPVTRWTQTSFGLSPLLTIPLRVAAGVGVIMIALFIAGTAGLYNAPAIVLLLLAGIALAIVPMLRQPIGLQGLRSISLGLGNWPWHRWWWLGLAVVVCLPLVLSPLQPPLGWDELMYHLPYARFWAEQGALAVNVWLRYPLSAYNMNLLYGASLLLASDVFPHLLHALTAILTAILTFGVARRYLDWRVGLIAAIELLLATSWGFSNAYVDLGVMLYWSCAFAALALRHEICDRRFVYLAAFFAGIAIGIKYQALLYLPVFGGLALAVERRPMVLAKSAIIFAGVGGYWYVRNALISGNPFEPIGGNLFGFWLWNAEELAGQFADLERVKDWPEWFFLFAIGAPFFHRGTPSPFYRGLCLAAACAAGVWLAVSGYPRYLTPVYPLLALLSAQVFVGLWSRSGIGPRVSALWAKRNPSWRFILAASVLLGVSLSSVGNVAKFWGRINLNEEARTAYLSKRLHGYRLLCTIGHDPKRTIYQLGFENEIYYLGKSVRGDWFGPGRYKDVVVRAHDPAALARHLKDMGVDILLLNLGYPPFASVKEAPAFEDHFELLAQSERAAIYRLRANALPPANQ